MTKTAKDERAERRQRFIEYLVKAFGFDPASGGDLNGFCKDLYELGHIDAPERSEGFKPRSAPLLEHLTGKFKDWNFGWVNDEHKGHLIIVNTPRVGGRQLGLYELLVVPVELCDPKDLDLARKRPKQTKPVSKSKPINPATEEQQFGWHFDGA